MNERQKAQGMYNKARYNLILMLAFTVVNIILVLTGSSVIMLFSATVPYMFAAVATATDVRGLVQLCGVIAAGSVCVYLLCWFFSKRHFGWMVAAMVLFVFDTLALIGLYVVARDFSGILDLIIHIWVLYYLVIGVRYGAKLQSMPEEAVQTIVADGYTVENNGAASVNTAAPDVMSGAENENATKPYMADTSGGESVLLEANAMGHNVCYRRVKCTNELMIDGYVYDSREMVIELPHTLSANIDGHLFEAGNDGSFNFIAADGETIKKERHI